MCVALPVFESWEENIQIIKQIKNIDSIYYLSCETMRFLFGLPFQSLEAKRKILKETKK